MQSVAKWLKTVATVMTNLSKLMILLATALVFNTSAVARDIGHNEVLELRRKGELLPFEQIIANVFERYPDAQIIEVELEENAGIYVYEIEILTHNNQIRELELNARSGEIIEDELED